MAASASSKGFVSGEEGAPASFLTLLSDPQQPLQLCPNETTDVSASPVIGAPSERHLAADAAACSLVAVVDSPLWSN